MPRSGGGVYSAPSGTLAVSQTTIESTKYNSFVADLVADANAARPIVAGGTGATTASGARTSLGLAIGTDVQAYDAGLTAIAALTTSANKMFYATGSDTFATTDLTAAARNLLDDADAAAMRTTLGLAIGTDVQAQGATLTSLEGLSLSAGDVLYATGADTLARLAIGTAGRALVVNSGATAPEYAGRAVTETSGTAPYYGFRAWGVIDNSGNLLAGGNVASTSGTDPCAVTFTTAAPNANYVVLVSGFGGSGDTRYPHVRTGTKATSGFSIANGHTLDDGIWFAAVW